SLLLTNYHHDFANAVPRGVPPETLVAFSNPLMLPQLRPQLEASFSRYENGSHLLETLYANVGASLLRGIQWIFLISAILMIALFLVNFLLKDVRWRHGPPQTLE